MVEEDQGLEESTTKWMRAGLVLVTAFVLIFPAYRLFEPGQRDDRRADLVASLAAQGESLYQFHCADCRDLDGSQLIAAGLPGSEMGSFSLDFGGSLTSSQIRAIVTYLRSLEDTAPDLPDWRNPRK